MKAVLPGMAGAGGVANHNTSCGGRSTPDIQPGYWDTYLPAYNGSTYMGLVARTDNTAEGIFQVLDSPLRAGTCYAFTVYLARSLRYDGFNNPINLEIWAGNTDCEKKELLWR